MRKWTSPCGSVVLHRADCFDFLQAAPAHSYAAVVTDPPYGSTDCRWDRPFDLVQWWQLVEAATAPAGVVASFAAQPFATNLIHANRRAFRYELVWRKNRPVGFLNANRQPLRDHELILIFCRQPGRSIYHPQKTPGKPYHVKNNTGKASVYRHHRRRETINHGDRHPRSVLAIDEPERGRWHPTQKPVALCEFLVRSYTGPGDIVLDPFAGSGSTALACLAAGRRFVGCERDPENFARAVERLKSYQPAASGV
jgi:site-specific DNA-methyltransferase (adenine-specific)